MQLTLEQAREIISSHDGEVHVASVTEIKSPQRCYHISLSDDADRCYLLLVSPLHQPRETPLSVLSDLLIKILDATPVPVPRPVAHDVSGTKWDFGWLLLRPPPGASVPPVSLASARTSLSPAQQARIELRLGTHLRALHDTTRDWFGALTAPEPSVSLTADEGADADMTLYSWQDTFVLYLETLLEEVRTNGGVDVDVDALRLALSRAIGSYLFDDVEMPRLVWVTGSDEDVVVSLAEGDVAYLLPTFGRALWGDPLMEAWFAPPGPSTAMMEGYFRGEQDGTLILFPRHKTKRTWYTVYLALLALAEEEEEEGGKAEWARRVLPECVAYLRTAPCY